LDGTKLDSFAMPAHTYIEELQSIMHVCRSKFNHTAAA